MEENIATVETLEFGNPKNWVPCITPECGNCAHAKTRRGLFPFHQCVLDKGTKHARYVCENFTPSQAALWLAWK